MLLEKAANNVLTVAFFYLMLRITINDSYPVLVYTTQRTISGNIPENDFPKQRKWEPVKLLI